MWYAESIRIGTAFWSSVKRVTHSAGGLFKVRGLLSPGLLEFGCCTASRGGFSFFSRGGFAFFLSRLGFLFFSSHENGWAGISRVGSILLYLL